jgi:type IV pilus assembly protein PilZ
MPRKKEVVARYPKKEKLLLDFKRRGPLGVLFVETGRMLKLSEAVTVVVEFPQDKRSFRVQGEVVSRRRASVEPPLPPGVDVEFPSEENKTVQMVLDHATGKQVDFKDRSSRRLHCSCVVSYRHDRGFVHEFAEDLGEGGTFIRTDNFYPVGTEVDCKLKPPGYLVGIKLRGRVAWLKETGHPKGMGIEFLFTSDRQRKKVRDLVNRLATQRGREVKKEMDRIRAKSRFQKPSRG